MTIFDIQFIMASLVSALVALTSSTAQMEQEENDGPTSGTEGEEDHGGGDKKNENSGDETEPDIGFGAFDTDPDEDSGVADKTSKVPDSTHEGTGARPKTTLETIQEESGKEDETTVKNKSNEKK